MTVLIEGAEYMVDLTKRPGALYTVRPSGDLFDPGPAIFFVISFPLLLHVAGSVFEHGRDASLLIHAEMEEMYYSIASTMLLQFTRCLHSIRLPNTLRIAFKIKI